MSMQTLWKRDGGYGEVLTIAVPLVLSTGSWSIQHFVDRVFLTWYSRDALAAVLPAGMLNFTFASFFIGTTAYVNTFVAQYSGAGRPRRVGPAVWQGIYFGLIAGVLMIGLIPFSETFFRWVGHDPDIRSLETSYFRISCLGGPTIVGPALAGFFSGRGKTMAVMWVNFVATGVNIVLDYAWIFGKWGFPEWGIEGAAAATVVSRYTSLAIYLVIISLPRFRETYNTLGGWRPDRALFRRLVRFGVPNGVQFMLEILGFSIFVLLVGRLGEVALAASNVAFNINTLAFLPMIGLGIAVSTMVGRYLGQDRADLAERSVWSAVHLVVLYMGSMALGYVLVPDLFIYPFASRADPETFGPVRELAIVLLKFVAVYCAFDGLYIVFSAGVKGAGDTRFVMLTATALSWLTMVLPTYIACGIYGKGLFVAYLFITTYITLAGIIFYLRFRGGKWKSMRVIEAAPPPAVPVGEDPDLPVT
ncbi:MAG: MATE family efflux transporter [Candidatus Latescibacteria bacterium]|jgi:MATE family multidrug resistance protein|nr:MATE family efflux transporter [Candidatus Latescibacterota bacterium]